MKWQLHISVTATQDTQLGVLLSISTLFINSTSISLHIVLLRAEYFFPHAHTALY